MHRVINSAFTLSPVLSEKFFLDRKINYEHQIVPDIIREKKCHFENGLLLKTSPEWGLVYLKG